MQKVDFVTVVNDFEKYGKYFLINDNINNHNLISYDNTTDNQPITARYNHYIDTIMADDVWIVFCHQDFEFHEDITPKLDNLAKDSIYTPVGAGTKKEFVFFVRMAGLKISKFRIGFVYKQVIKGQIREESRGRIKYAGKKAKVLEIIETPDCCCFIVHSSLIRKMNYRFDDNLDWHLYAEDLALTAKLNFGIKTRILNITSSHYSGGDFNLDFYESIKYLKDKYKGIPIVTTCYDGNYENFLNRL